MKLAFLAALLPLLARAQESTPLDPVVVTATRTEQAQSQTLASTLVISRDEIEAASANDLADLLRFYAGIEVDRAGGPGQLAQVRVRGGETDHVLLLVDGVKVNPATNGPALQGLLPEAIERIEIVKGPRASLYGSEGISATINLITRAATGGELSGRLGSYGTRQAAAALGDQQARSSWSLDAGHLRSDGFPTCTDSDLDRGTEQVSFGARGSARVGATMLSGSALDRQGETEYMNFGCPAPVAAVSQEFHDRTLSGSVALTPASAWTTTLAVSHVLDDLRQQQAPDHARTTRPRVDWSNVIALPANQVSLGAELEHEHSEALFTGFGTTFVEEGRDIAALRAQDELDAGRHHALAALRVLHDSGFGDHAVWNAEYGIDLAATRLIATAGTGYRAPTFLERSPGFFGNPDLQPEQSRAYELGARQAFAPGNWLEVRAFRTDTTNLITGFPPQNVASARSEGLELTYRAIVDAWSGTLTGIVQDPQDRRTGEQLARRAKRSAALKVERRLGAHRVGVDLLATSRRPDTDFSTFPARSVTLGGYALVNAHATLQLDPHWSVQLAGENLLDQDYVTAFGYRQPGASVYVGVRWRY